MLFLKLFIVTKNGSLNVSMGFFILYEELDITIIVVLLMLKGRVLIMANPLDEYWEFLVDQSIATEAELQLVTDINGYSEETLDDILYCRTGYRSREQYCDAEGIEYESDEEEEDESKSINSVTNKILEGADVSKVLGIATEASTVLRDQDITSTDDVDELYLYIANDGQLYRNRTTPIINNLKKKYKKGDYDKDLAVKAFMYLVDDGVRKYDKEFGSGQGKLFLDKKTREEIAKQLRDRYEEDIMEE